MNLSQKDILHNCVNGSLRKFPPPTPKTPPLKSPLPLSPPLITPHPSLPPLFRIQHEFTTLLTSWIEVTGAPNHRVNKQGRRQSLWGFTTENHIYLEQFLFQFCITKIITKENIKSSTKTKETYSQMPSWIIRLWRDFWIYDAPGVAGCAVVLPLRARPHVDAPLWQRRSRQS